MEIQKCTQISQAIGKFILPNLPFQFCNCLIPAILQFCCSICEIGIGKRDNLSSLDFFLEFILLYEVMIDQKNS